MSCFNYQLWQFRFDLLPGVQPKIGTGDKEETVAGLLSNLTLEGLGPQWIRPRPPRLPVQDGEVSHVVVDCSNLNGVSFFPCD